MLDMSVEKLKGRVMDKSWDEETDLQFMQVMNF